MPILSELLMNPSLIFNNEKLHHYAVSVISGLNGVQAKVKDLAVGGFLLFFHREDAVRKWALQYVATSNDKQLRGACTSSIAFFTLNYSVI